MTNSWPLQKDVKTFYGNPDANGDGVPDRAWEDANLVKVFPPFKMVLAWDTTQPVKSIRIHKKCAVSLTRVFANLALRLPTQLLVDHVGLNLFGGAYNFRMKRGGNTLSMHSYGCAIDISPEDNGFGKHWEQGTRMMDLSVIQEFKAEGWIWGGDWKYPDPMHFQAAIV